MYDALIFKHIFQASPKALKEILTELQIKEGEISSIEIVGQQLQELLRVIISEKGVSWQLR